MNPMEQKSLSKRFILPVAIVLGAMIVTSIIYLHLAWKIDGDNPLRPLVTTVSAWALFISIGFGALYIYPKGFFGGASVAERIIGCLVTPLVWNVKEMVRVSEFFTLGETLYYGLNTVFLLAVFSALGQMGLCELVCRWRLGKRSREPVKVFSPAPVIAIFVGLAALYVCLLWGLGVHFFYIYIEGYRAIFV
jgi:hypothetical protein